MGRFGLLDSKPDQMAMIQLNHRQKDPAIATPHKILLL